MPRALHTIIALEKGAKAEGQGTLDKAYHVLQKNALLSGISRTYEPVNEEGETLPPEYQKVQIRVSDVLADVSDALSRMFDTVATKETSNTIARGTIKVGATVIAEDVPVGFLLFLEKQLINVHTFVSKLPTLDPAEEWRWDPNSNAYVTDVNKKVRTVKVTYPLVLAPATDKHPAQVQIATRDEKAGEWLTVKRSGAMEAEAVVALMRRVEALQRAVKVAREEANSVTAIEVSVGESIFNYLAG